jgi:hypothetical protein
MAEKIGSIPSAGVEWITALTSAIPDLKAIYDTYRDPVTGKWNANADLISDKITDTQWFRDNGPTVAAKLADRYKNGEKNYQDQVGKYKVTVSALATAIGLDAKQPEVSNYLNKLAETSYLHNWDNANIEDQILSNDSIVNTIKGGQFSATVSSLADFAHTMGQTLNETDKKSYQQRLIGTMDANGIRVKSSVDDIKKEITGNTAALYPTFAEQLKSGTSLWDLTAGYRKKMADTLEVDPASISWNDPLWQNGKIFQSVDPKSGQIQARPLWEVDKLLKADDRWQYTKNAADTYDKYTYSILQKFGMVG